MLNKNTLGVKNVRGQSEVCVTKNFDIRRPLYDRLYHLATFFCTYKGGQLIKPIIYVVTFLASADIKEFGRTYLTIYNAASDWPHTFFIPRVFLFSINIYGIVNNSTSD